MSISYHGNTQTGENYIIVNGDKSEVVKLHVDEQIVNNQNTLKNIIKAAYLLGKKEALKEMKDFLD